MTNRLILKSFLILLLTGNAVVKGQNNDLLFNHLTVNNGLSQGVNNCVYKDSRGYTWISSFDGLNRFDGIECTIFRENSTQKKNIKGTLFLNILEDKKSDLWIGSNEGLNRYDRQHNVFSCYQVPTAIQSDKSCSPFYIDNDNNIWLQCAADIWLFNTRNKKFSLVHHFETNNPLIVTPTAGKYNLLEKMYVAIRNEPVLFMLDKKRQTFEVTPLTISTVNNTATIKSILSFNNDCWIGTSDGLYHLFNNNFQLISNSAHISFTTLGLDKKGQLWAGTFKNGLYVVDTKNNRLTNQYTATNKGPYSISGNQVQYIYADDQHNLWVSIWGKGVDYTNLEKFRFRHHLPKEEATALKVDNFIRSIVQVNNSEIWCGTQSNGIIILNKEKKVTGSITKGIPPAIEHLCKDDKGNIWIATLAGLFVTNAATKIIQPIKGFGLPVQGSNQFNFVYQLANGKIIVSGNAGLFWVTINNAAYQLSPVHGCALNEVYLTAYQDTHQNIYISKPFKGFAVYRAQHDSLHLLKQINLPATIKCFSETNDSILWIGSTVGLIKFNKILSVINTIYTTANGLSNQYIYGVIPYQQQLWLSSNGGISVFDVNNHSIKNFNEGDGLQSNEFNTYAFCKTSEGELLFGGVNGINSFIPSTIKKYPYSPQLQLEQIFVNDTLSHLATNPGELSELHLTYAENTVSFQFVALDFANASGNYIFYRLAGYDKSWIQTTNKAIIRYANLPSGKYTLHVKAVNSEGNEAKQLYQLLIFISTPWYNSWWFRLLLATAIVFIITSFVRNYYQRKLKKQKTILENQQAIERERTRIATDMHDDFGASISRIKFLSEKLQLQHNSEQKLAEGLEKISHYSDEMAEKMGEIVWALNQRYDPIADLISFCRSYAAELVQDKNIRLHFTATEHSPQNIKGEIRRNIFLVMKEALHNIIKHSDATEISITMQSTELLTMIITDNGKGFAESEVRPFANGIANMKKRMLEIGGTFSISHQPGICITITV